MYFCVVFFVVYFLVLFFSLYIFVLCISCLFLCCVFFVVRLVVLCCEVRYFEPCGISKVNSLCCKAWYCVYLQLSFVSFTTLCC